MELEATALIEVLKAQRNEALDQLAMAQAVIAKLRAELVETRDGKV